MFSVKKLNLFHLLCLSNIDREKVFAFSNYDCSTSELFQNLRRVISKARMMHSIVNNTAPEYLTSRFIGRCDLASYNMRMNTHCNCNPLVTPCNCF